LTHGQRLLYSAGRSRWSLGRKPLLVPGRGNIPQPGQIGSQMPIGLNKRNPDEADRLACGNTGGRPDGILQLVTQFNSRETPRRIELH
jgi:hypothetical protein